MALRLSTFFSIFRFAKPFGASSTRIMSSDRAIIFKLTDDQKKNPFFLESKVALEMTSNSKDASGESMAQDSKNTLASSLYKSVPMISLKPPQFLKKPEQSKDSYKDDPNLPVLTMPQIGFGTYKVGIVPTSASSAKSAVANEAPKSIERTAEECVADALDVGYRFIECAQFYMNESEVGKAIAKSGIERKDLFLCSKVWTTTIEQGPQAVEEQLERTLADLGIDYIDLYLIHWPVPGKHVEAYKTLERLAKDGKIRGIGVSNYAWEDYLELKEAGVENLPLVNQIEINPFLYRKNTIARFAEEGVVLQSYRSLRDGKAFDDPTVLKVAQSHNRSAAQILGRWCVQKGFIYIPKSVRKDRMVENSKVFDFELSDEEMEELDDLTTESAIETFGNLYRKVRQ